MATWEDAEGHPRSTLNIIQRMSIPCFLNLLLLSGNKKAPMVQSNTLLGTLEVLKRPDNSGDESH